jgi:hypothetical protein
MGKSTPDPPPAPNPVAVSAAQTDSNINTGIANSVMGNANTYDPYGSTTFKQIGTTNVGGNAVPQWQKNTTLAPAQQQMLDLQNQTGINLNKTALNSSNQIGDLLSHPVDTNGLTDFAGVPQSPNFNGLPNGPQYSVAQLQGMGGSPFDIQGNVGVGQQATSFGGVGQQSTSVPGGTSQQATSFNGGGPLQTSVQQNPYDTSFGQTSGNIQNGVQQNPYATSFRGGGPMQNFVGQNPYATSFGQTSGNIQNSVGPQDFSADRQATTDALLSRLNPQIDRDRAALENQLVNQGFVRGTTQFDNQMDQINRQANDQRTQAVLAGGQEQSRLAGLQLNQANFANQAQAQDYGQQQGRGLFGLQAGEAQNAANLNQANFTNQAQAQRFGQNQAQGQFGLQATQAQNAANLNAGNFANSAQAQDYGQQQGRGLFGLQATGQNNAANLNAANFANTTQGQLFGQNQAQGQFGNQAIAANNATNFNAGNFANSAISANNAANLAAGQFGNQAIGANNAANLSAGTFANSAAGQAFAQQQAQLAFNNAVSQGNAQGANDAANQAYQNAVQQAQYGNTNAQQGFSNEMAGSQLQDQIRAQQLQERYGLASFPINHLSARMSGGQIQAPQNVNYNGGQIAPTNVSGNYYNSAALDQQNYQSQLAQQNAAMGGLFGLGSAAINGIAKNPTAMATIFGSDRRLKRDIIDTGIRLMNGLKLYSYRYLWDAAERIGVMADEVRKVVPQAVININGYDAVNYDMVMEVA